MEEYNFCPGPCPLCDEIRRQRKNAEIARIKKMKDDMLFFAQTVWALPISSHVIRETMLLFDDEPSKEDFKKEVTLLRKEKFDLQEDNVRLKKLYEELQERTNYLRRCWEEASKRLLEAQRMNSSLTAMPLTFASQFPFNNEPLLNKEISELNRKLADALRDAKANDTLATDLNRQVVKLNQQLKDSGSRYISMRNNRDKLVMEIERHGKALGDTRKELDHNKTRVEYLSGLVENERGANAGRIGRICDLEEKLRDANAANGSLRAAYDDVEKQRLIIGNANKLLREQIDDLKDRYTKPLTDDEVSGLYRTNEERS
jgi:chromosome segregation ATPase